MPTSGFRLFKLFGITVFLHWSWFFIAVYEVQMRKVAYHFIGWNIAECLSLFVIVLLHEFGHALACRSVGGQAERIVLWPLGGVAYVSPPMRPGAMLWSIAAGPLVNVALIPLTLWFLFMSGHSDALTLRFLFTPGYSDADTFLRSVAAINLGLLIFNMLPIYPLDGGKILWALLWFPLGLSRALMIASVIGIIGAAAGLLLAIRLDDILLIALAIFAAFQAYSGLKSAQTLRRREKIPRRPGVACPACGTAPPMGPFWICTTCHARFDAFDHPDACPGCGKPHHWNTCLSCGARAPFPAWNIPTAPATRVVASPPIN
jgi:Zn-dependent protease